MSLELTSITQWLRVVTCSDKQHAFDGVSILQLTDYKSDPLLTPLRIHSIFSIT